MKKIFPVLVILLFCVAGGCGQKKEAVIQIDDVKVTIGEFDKAFGLSRFASMGEEGRQAFLEAFISRKIILKKAEELGLDKDPTFLMDVQIFWEQSLLKLVLSQKSKELITGIIVSEKEIGAYYESNKETSFSGKELSEVRGQIEWFLLKQKQEQAVLGWVNALREDSTVVIDYQKLGIKK